MFIVARDLVDTVNNYSQLEYIVFVYVVDASEDLCNSFGLHGVRRQCNVIDFKILYMYILFLIRLDIFIAF